MGLLCKPTGKMKRIMKKLENEQMKEKQAMKNKKKEKQKMELLNTIDMMTSDDYKERFKAEYFQVLIRYKKLQNMLDTWDEGKLDFTPTCPRSTYDLQMRAMKDYIAVLEARAMMENVNLESVIA